MALNHVAMVRSSGELVEAVMPKVQTITLNQFIGKSVCDGLGRPCILVARLKSPWLPLVDKALAFVDEQLHIPHNDGVSSEDHAQSDIGGRICYCSDLVLEAFRLANKGEPIFPEAGSHPALLSSSNRLDVIRVIGQLPARQAASEQLV